MLFAQANHLFHHINQCDSHLNYVCPQCELPVVTEKKEYHHFIPNPKCGIKSESELHFIAKKIIAYFGVITFPDSKMKHTLQSVELEKAKSMFYFDIFALQIGEQPIVIEINHQSPITKKKKQYIQNQNIDAIEIDIDDGYISDDIVDFVLSYAPRRWIWKSDFSGLAIKEPDISKPQKIEHPIYTQNFLKNYIFALRSKYPNLEKEIFLGTVEKQHRLTGLPKSIRYVLNCKKLHHRFIKHICILPGEYSFKTVDVGKIVSFLISCDPNRFIYNPQTKRSLFIPIAIQIAGVDHNKMDTK